MTRADRTSAHTRLLREILLALGQRPDVIVWEHKTGLFRLPVGDGRVPVGLPGSPDIIGLARGNKPILIEVKTGKATPTPQQRIFHARAADLGAPVCVARSVAAAVAYVEKLVEALR